jgi:arginyl-tRNA synthetase
MIEQLKAPLSAGLAPLLKLEAAKIHSLLESPKQAGHGQLALPVFSFAKEMKKAPPVIAQEFKTVIEAAGLEHLQKVEAVSGFVNFTFDPSFVQKMVFADAARGPENLGHQNRFAGKVATIDYSSPNVAKPMSIGHLRSTVIGQAIAHLAETQGYKVQGVNYLGDWGVQFGKLAWAYREWGKEYSFEEDPIDSLFKLYVRFHQEAEKDPRLEEEGSLMFKRLEDGDEELRKIWKYFVELSLKGYEKQWKRLGVKHSLVRGESYYNDRLKGVVQMLKDKGLLELSEGAQVVRLDEEGMPPCLITKKDGASLYATRDIASAIDRVENLNTDLNLYVVGAEQTLHFRQIFRVLEKAGFSWAKDCHHIAFGMYRFGDLKMSTRKGNVIFLDDVLNKAVEYVLKMIEEKNPDVEGKEEIAEIVGVGAIVFNDLMNDRQKNVDFNWDKILDFNGDSGPYVQYTAVRCRSLMQKTSLKPDPDTHIVLDSAEEAEVFRHLLLYGDVLSRSFDHFKPHILAGYLLELCKLFNQYYAKQRILDGSEAQIRARLMLVNSLYVTLVAGLGVLGIKVPKAM